MINEFYKAVYICALSLGLFTNLALYLEGHRRNIDTGNIILFQLVSLVFPLHAYIQLNSPSLPFEVSVFIHCFILLYGPILYFILNSISKTPLRLRDKIKHLSPFLLLSLIVLTDPPYSRPAILLFACSLVLAYSALNLKLAIEKRHLILLILRRFRFSSYFWLIYIATGACLYALGDVSLLLIEVAWLEIDNFYWRAWVSVIAIFSISISLITLFSYFTVENHELEQHSSLEPTDNKVEAKGLRCELTDSQAKELEALLTRLSLEQKPQLENDLSLGKLAELLDITSVQLTELLNQHMNTNFYRWLNKLRYEEATQLLNDPNTQLPILDVAYLAGFNNKNTFYKTFKEYSGLTPSQYRRQQSCDHL